MNGDEDAPHTVDLIGLIDRLAEASAPPPISMVPQTAGWVVLAVLLALALVWLVWRLLRHRRANAYRRAALDAIEAAADDPAAIAAILRRTALAAWPRETVASLAGADWLRFLDATGGGGGFADGPGTALVSAPYRGGPPAPGLGALAERWVRRHRVEVAP